MSQTSMKKKESRSAYRFLSPWLIGLLGFSAFPIIGSLYFSFTNYNFLSDPKWVGLQNYVNLFTNDTKFAETLRVTFTYVLIAVPLELLFSLCLAMLLNVGLRGVGVYRSVYYIPSLFGGSVAVAILWIQVFGADGAVNGLLGVLGIDAPSWVGTPGLALWSIIFLKLWQFGAPTIIFLAGLKGIPRELYEASALDGAGWFRQFRAVTVPMLSPFILFNGIMEMITAFQAFTPAYIISGGTGGPVNSTLFYTLYLYQAAFKDFRMGYSSAMAWILLIIIAAFAAIMFKFSKRFVHYDS